MLDTYEILYGITALILQTIGKIRDKTRRQCKCAVGGWGLQGRESRFRYSLMYILRISAKICVQIIDKYTNLIVYFDLLNTGTHKQL